MPLAARLLAALLLAAACGAAGAQRMPVPLVPNPSLVDERRPAAATTAPAPAPALPVPQAAPADMPAAPPVVVDAPPPAVAVPALADIALVLPLRSHDYARAAEAVRDGFLAAATAAGRADRCRVIDHDDGGVAAAFDAAAGLGARVVVGPLVRDDLRTIASSGTPLPLTLALNQFDDGTPLPPSMLALTLSTEADARLLARRMRDDLVASVAIIGNDGPLQRRFAVAFTDAWLAAGGGVPEGYRFDLAPDALTLLRRELARSNAQAALVTLPGAQAALARSFAPRLPAYASSLVNEPMDVAALADLEGVIFVDVPWLVRPDDPAFAAFARPDLGSNVLQRLYALGLDAFAVAQAFVDGVPDRLSLQGATGRLTLGDGRVLRREGDVATFRHGQVVPADVPR